MHLTPSCIKISRGHLLSSLVLACSILTAAAEVQVTVEQNSNDSTSSVLRFKTLGPPLRGDRAASAKFSVVDGRVDPNSGGLDTLHDGRAPTEDDDPGANFFFGTTRAGGRVLVDLTNVVEIRQINTYSWHPGTRGPQVYSLYASDGAATGFNPEPRNGTEPESCGWKRLANVDTRPKGSTEGGQFAVGLSDSTGSLGKFRYLLFCIEPTETNDWFGNTFYSEIDVLEANVPIVEEPAPAPEVTRQVLEIENGAYQVTMDTTETPDLTDWVKTNLAPAVVEWYPKLVKLLPSEGYQAPRKVTVFFSKNMQGVADTAGTRIRVAARWFRQNLKGEATGSIVHELVHVVQQYKHGGVPGWLTEGIADYTRFFVFEPQTHGAEIGKRSVANAHYDASYRTTANFLNWACAKYDAQLVAKLNGLARDGKYTPDAWNSITGHTAAELGDEWKQELQKKLESQ